MPAPTKVIAYGIISRHIMDVESSFISGTASRPLKYFSPKFLLWSPRASLHMASSKLVPEGEKRSVKSDLPLFYSGQNT